MLRGDGERRVYQEQGGGEEERGAVLQAPQVSRDQLAVAGRTEQTSPAPEALTHWELPVLPGGPEGLPGPAYAGVHTDTRRAAYPHRILHPHCGAARSWQPDQLLQPGPPRRLPGCFQSHHMLGSLGSSSGQLEPEVFPKSP